MIGLSSPWPEPGSDVAGDAEAGPSARSASRHLGVRNKACEWRCKVGTYTSQEERADFTGMSFEQHQDLSGSHLARHVAFIQQNKPLGPGPRRGQPQRCRCRPSQRRAPGLGSRMQRSLYLRRPRRKPGGAGLGMPVAALYPRRAWTCVDRCAVPLGSSAHGGPGGDTAAATACHAITGTGSIQLARA